MRVEDVNGPDLHVSPGRLDDSERRFVRPGMPAMHHEGDGDAVGLGHNLQHLGAQVGESCMKRSRPGSEIGQREI